MCLGEYKEAKMQNYPQDSFHCVSLKCDNYLCFQGVPFQGNICRVCVFMSRGSKETETPKNISQNSQNIPRFPSTPPMAQIAGITLLLHSFVPGFQYTNIISTRASALPCPDHPCLVGLCEAIEPAFGNKLISP